MLLEELHAVTFVLCPNDNLSIPVPRQALLYTNVVACNLENCGFGWVCWLVGFFWLVWNGGLGALGREGRGYAAFLSRKASKLRAERSDGRVNWTDLGINGVSERKAGVWMKLNFAGCNNSYLCEGETINTEITGAQISLY